MTTKDERALAHPRRAPGFTPVPRRSRDLDGWTVERQRGFIAALAEMGSVRHAARAVGMSWASAYQLRKARGGESFAKAWAKAVSSGVSLVYDTLIDHSINGIPEPVFHAGKEVGERRRFNHKTMKWIVDRGAPGQQSGAAEEEPIAAVRERILKRLDALAAKLEREAAAEKAAELATIRNDPARRAAWETLHGAIDAHVAA